MGLNVNTVQPADATPVTKIVLLGPVAAYSADNKLPIGGPKQRILLARLALGQGRPVSAGALIDDLWGEQLPRNSTHALQAHISRLRAAIHAPIEAVQGGYLIDNHKLDVDALQFERLCERGRAHLNDNEPKRAVDEFDEAFALWQGSAFSDLPDVIGLRPFIVRLNELRRSAATDCIEAKLQTGQTGTIIGELRAHLETDPLHERSWQQLMIGLYRDGRESESLEVYRAARETFIDSLGSEPGIQLMRTHQAILDRSLPIHETDTPHVKSSITPKGHARTSKLALTGRDQEWRVLEREWHNCGDGIRMVTVSGEPGIGKTRLVSQFAESLNSTGVHILAGRCDPSVTEAFQPFTHMLRFDVDSGTGRSEPQFGQHSADLLRVLQPTRQQPTDTRTISPDPDTDRHHSFDAVAAWLEVTSKNSPIVVTIDDVHWADEPTAMLLLHLLHTPRRIRALFLITARNTELPQDRDDTSVVRTLRRQSDTVTHLPLTRLTEVDSSALLHAEIAESVAASHVLPELSQRIAHLSGGNPLFIVEVARQFGTRQDGPPTQLDTAIPSGINDVINERLTQFDADVRETLTYAAVIGTQFNPIILQLVGTVSQERLDVILTTATGARLIEPTSGPGMHHGFCHELVRAALYQAIPPIQRASMHQSIAEAIEEHHSSDLSPYYDVLAHHFGVATSVSDEQKAIQYLVLAGQNALDHSAPALAVDYFTQALALIPDHQREKRCDVLTVLGIAERNCANPGYRQRLLAAAQLALQLGDHVRLSTAVIANTRGWWSSTAEIDYERVAVIDAALNNYYEISSTARVHLLISWAVENIRDPARREQAIAYSSKAVELAEQLGDDEALAQALSHRYAVIYATLGDLTECVHINERLLTIADRRADHGLRLSAAVGMAQSTMTLGEFSIADRYLDQAAQLAESLNQLPRLWLVRGWQAMRLATRGHLDDAEQAARQAFELGKQTGQPDADTWFAGQLFTFRMLQGRLVEFVDDVGEQVAAHAGGIPSWRAASTLALAYLDEQASAAQLEDFAADDFEQLPHDMLWLHGMTYLSMACHQLQRADIAAQLYGALVKHSGLMAHNGTIDAGPVDLQLGLMAQLSGQAHVARQHFAASASLCRRIDAPLWLAQIKRQTPI